MKQPEIFESVFHKYYASLCYFANKFVRDDEVARDIVQEVFLRFWESKGKIFDYLRSLVKKEKYTKQTTATSSTTDSSPSGLDNNPIDQKNISITTG